MPTSAAEGLRFGEVGGVAVYVEDHVAGGVLYLIAGVSCGIVEYPEGVSVRFLSAFCLLLGDGTKCSEHGWFSRNRVV